ncbi:MAG: hypothetical protein MJ236_03820 [Clostridia bacterium]|nr:hypothetical protein [Clostridia bacterium]
MKLKKILVMMVTMLLCMSVSVFASSEVPYQTYTLDKWGNATPSPNGYVPQRSIGGAQLGCKDFSGAQDLFYSETLKLVLVTDTGNSRIVVLNDNFEFQYELTSFTNDKNEEITLNKPEGAYLLDDGTLYICDTGNQRIISCTLDGKLNSVLSTPESELLDENFVYRPSKLVVDEDNRMYIISKGTYQGLIYLDTNGEFIRYFGANKVEMTFRRRMLKIWKSILPEKAAASIQSFNPIEYGNLYMSNDGYVFATAAGSEDGSSLMTKLNPLGIDVLPFKIKGQSLFSDVSIDKNGIITCLDTTYGLIFQYDGNGKLMFSFGGIGSQVGLFQKAVSLIEVNNNLYVLDSEKNTITEFTLTQFGEMVKDAIVLYDEGKYEESIKPWEKVSSHNANYLLSYIGLGKAYYQLKDYDTAMYYFKLANDRADYSDAFREASLIAIRASFTTVALILIALAIVIIVLSIVVKKYNKKHGTKGLEMIFKKKRGGK